MAVRTRGYAHRVDIAAPAARVWAGLTEPALLARWHGPMSVVKAKTGGRFAGVLDPGIEREALIDVFEPGRRLRLIYLLPAGFPSYDGAVVDDYLLEPDGNGKTVVRLLNSGIPEGPPWDSHYVKLRVAAERALARLKLLLESKAGPATPAGAATTGGAR